MLDRSSTRYVVVLYLLDIVLTIAALAAAEAIRPRLPFGKEVDVPGGTVQPEVFLAAAVVWTISLAMASAYDPHRMIKTRDEVRTVTVAVSQAALVLAGFLYMTFRGLSRLLFVTFFVLDLVFILTARMVLRLALKWTRPPTNHRVLIIGVNKVAAAVADQVAALRWMGLELVGHVQENGVTADGGNDETGSSVLNAPVLGGLEDVPTLVQSHSITELIIAIPLRAHGALPRLVAAWQHLPVNIKVVPDFFDLVYFRSTTEQLGGMPLIGIKEPVLSPSARLVKRLLDVAVAVVALVILSPVVAVIAILIRLDSPGPIIFRQQRVGEGGKTFTMYKFRTMTVGAEQLETSLMVRDENGRLIFQKRPDDPRLTRLGRWLRRTSLDEVPQFLNVLKGEMSLVGPRPELPLIVQGYERWQHKRFAVPPGMTGWWQVHRRGQQPLHLRTDDDLYYIQNYSLLLDLRILWDTIGAVISGRGAY